MKKYLPLIIILSLIVASCASIGNPSGGARDEDAPRFVRANPAPGSVNVNRQRIDIEFDEIVNVKDAFSKVVVSPYTGSVPRVSSQGRRVTVQFNDTLLPDATYTIDFGNSIEDNNEGNKLQGFTYSFATGPTLDTLQISGMVLSADALEPQQGILVGVYSNLSDTAFSTLPFERMAKTDDRGRFSIKGLAPGQYRIFALNDVDNDYKRANPEETMAFYDFLLSPSTERVMASDTVWNLITGEVDSVMKRERTRFLPNDILLRTFESGYTPQYLKSYERLDSTRLQFIFNAPTDSLPIIEPVERGSFTDWFRLERSAKNDTLTYWITDPTLIAVDSLRIAATYLKPDSARNLVWGTDTLRFFMADKKKSVDKKKDKKKNEEEMTDSLPPKPDPLEIKMITSSSHEVYLPLIMEFGTPLNELDSTKFILETKIDTIWTPVNKPFRIEPRDSVSQRFYKIAYPWELGTEYRLTVDSLAATGIYGNVNDPMEHNFKTKNEDEYCAINFTITNFIDTVPAFVELLNSSDNPVRRVPVNRGKAEFKYLPSGKYYARIVQDHNGNGIFDTGDYESFAQPDLAYYYPKVINIKKNWEKTETWDVFATAVDMMKPEVLKKNKPDMDKRSRAKRDANTYDDEEDEDEFYSPVRNNNNGQQQRRGMSTSTTM